MKSQCNASTKKSLEQDDRIEPESFFSYTIGHLPFVFVEGARIFNFCARLIIQTDVASKLV